MRVAILLAGLVATPALADPIKLKPLIDARLRYESVDQAGIVARAEAVTARVRAGFEARAGDFALLAESEATLALVENYNSGLNGRTSYPLVPDAQNIELNRLQLQYRGLPKTIVTLGRQRINLDDHRFIGLGAGWRQNEQTFDAARVEWTGLKNLKADLTYSWSDRTIWGINGGNRFGPARLQSIGGNNVFVNLALTTNIGTLTGFTYLIDQDEPLTLANSNAVYGARFVGSHPLSKTAKLSYAFSCARQTDYRRNPNRYTANYYAADLGLAVKAFTIGGGVEVLGADRGVALTSFQTPLATLHRFNGWADKFLVTPPDGLVDGYGSLAYSWKKPGPFDSIAVVGVYHRFGSDRLGRLYGDEIDVSATAKMKRYTFILKYADYRPASFATDTKRFWASVVWAVWLKSRISS